MTHKLTSLYIFHEFEARSTVYTAALAYKVVDTSVIYGIIR